MAGSTCKKDSSTKTIILIRHGKTDWNAEGRWQGHLDIPLNGEGLLQAQSLARRLTDWPVQALYSSDLKRAAMTADILGHSLSLEPIYDSVWRERDVGAFAGLTGPEVRKKFPQAWERMRNGIVNPPEGEEYLQLYHRATVAFEQLLSRHENEKAVVVSHGGTIYCVIAYVLGIGPERYGSFSLSGNTGLSIVEVGERGPRLTLLNDTCHLD